MSGTSIVLIVCEQKAEDEKMRTILCARGAGHNALPEGCLEIFCTLIVQMQRFCEEQKHLNSGSKGWKQYKDERTIGHVCVYGESDSFSRQQTRRSTLQLYHAVPQHGLPRFGAEVLLFHNLNAPSLSN